MISAHDHRLHAFATSREPHAGQVFFRIRRRTRIAWFIAGLIVGDVSMFIATHWKVIAP
jgi:hypothetical protein